MKPTKGSWLPTKALGGGKVSAAPLSTSMSSKLLVSMSLFSSGTTGATAGGQKQKERKLRSKKRRGGGANQEEVREKKVMFYINRGNQEIKTWSYKYLKIKYILKTSIQNSVPALALLAVGVSSLQVGVSLTPLLFPHSACFVPHTQCLSPAEPKRLLPPRRSSRAFASLHNGQTRMCQRANQIKLS